MEAGGRRERSAGWFEGPPRKGPEHRTLLDRFLSLREARTTSPSRDAAPPQAAGHPQASEPEARGVVADRVARARQEAGLTTKELAERLNLSIWMIERLEAGEADAAPHLASIARATAKQEERLRPAQDVATPSDETAARQAEPSAVRYQIEMRKPASVLIALSLASLVMIRFFTEAVPILPRFANFIDLPIFVAVVIAAVLRPAGDQHVRAVAPPLLLGYVFVVVCAVSMLTNISRVDVAPALMFVYGVAGPLVLCWAVYRLWPAGSSLSLSRLLVALGVLEIVLVFTVNVPQFILEQDPDVISGTFGENPYQLVFFLLLVIALLAGIFTFEKRRAVTRFAPVLLLASLVIIFLAQYRALLLTTALTIVLLGVLLGPSSARGAVVAVVTTAMLLVVLAYVAQNMPALKFGAVITQARENPSFYFQKRLATIGVVGRLFGEDPRFMVTGTGPGTYSSRAWSQFAQTSESTSDVAGDYVQRLTGGRPYSTDVSSRYVVPQLRNVEVVSGSRAVSSPFSSYSSLLAEVGLIGFGAILVTYVWALLCSLRMAMRSIRAAQPGDSLPALLCASTVAFFVILQMALLENWLEVTRMTFVSWILFAVAAKEFNARKLAT